MPPGPKKSKLENEGAESNKMEETEGETMSTDAAGELERDAPAITGARVKDVEFLPHDTTMNCIPSAFGNMLMPLTDGGVQFLLAGARANVGLKSGRYMFEVKVVELMHPAEDAAVARLVRSSCPRNVLRIGFATRASSLFLGDGEENFCYDMEGAFIHNKKKQDLTSQKFATGDVIALLINLDSTSPNANTASVFKNGVRASQPQAIPPSLKGKELFPAVTFRNLSLHYNFGPAPLRALPFTCHMVKAASEADTVTAAPVTKTKDGKQEVVFPVFMPDEGTFDWVDVFVESNKHYTELSDRAVLSWAEKSGLPQPKAAKSSNDKPEMGFGVPMMDDGSIRRVLSAVAPIQQRNYIVMEVKSNLLKDERRELLGRWSLSGFKRTAAVMMGEPPQAFRKRTLEFVLKSKQEASDAEFRAARAEEKRKKLLEKRQKQLERERKKAAKASKKKQEALKRRLEEEKRKREKAEKGESEESEANKKEEAPKEGQEEEEKDSDDAKEAEAEEEEVDETEAQPPKVELTAEEKKQWFRKPTTPDITPYLLSTSFTKFSVPEKDEGFDEIRYDWSAEEKCRDHVKQWVRARKLTTRIEDLQPSEWFAGKWKDWQKRVQGWHAKQNQHKALVAKAAEAAAKAAAEKAASAEKAKAKEAAERAEAQKEEPKGEPKEDAPSNAEGTTTREEKCEDPEEQVLVTGFEKLDVFGVEDILDVGDGQPLFSRFTHEDWTMMGLRFEMYLLTHAFRRDVNDADRVGIHLEHLPFYYNKYFKKALNTKMYGADSVKELLEHIKDTVVVCGKNQVVQPMLPDDMESLGVFVMITEESRRDRTRRVNLGDESAALRVSSSVQQAAPAAAPASSRLSTTLGGAVVRPLASAAAQRPAVALAWPRAASSSPYANGATRPPSAHQVLRPQQGLWRGFGR